MRDLREWIRLVHELGELTRPKELFKRSRDRLIINQFLWHEGFHILQTHALFHRTFHAHQANAKLIFNQFTNCSHPSVPQVVNIVNHAIAILQLYQIAYDLKNIFPA